jgi:hypothetical protein
VRFKEAAHGVICHLSRIQSYHIKSIRRNRGAGLGYPEVFGPPDKQLNISVKSSHNQEEEEDASTQGRTTLTDQKFKNL